jgi:hypothetical protein
MTDLGADGAYVGAAAKLKEHYGIEVPVSALRWGREEHGEAMRAQEKQKRDWPDGAGVRVLITEIDGSMLPVGEVAEPGGGSSIDGSEKERPFLEPAHLPDPEAPVRACFPLDLQPLEFLGLQRPLAAGLPIGSGEIESGHLYVFQNRLKISGAWWKMENLRKMIALRVLRANRGWEDYWSNVHQQAA